MLQGDGLILTEMGIRLMVWMASDLMSQVRYRWDSGGNTAK